MSGLKSIRIRRRAGLGGILLAAIFAAALMASPASAGHKSKHNPGGQQSTIYDFSLVGHLNLTAHVVTGECLSCAEYPLTSFLQLGPGLDDFCLASPSHLPPCASDELLITHGHVEFRVTDDQIDVIQVTFRRENHDNLFIRARIEISPVTVPSPGEDLPRIHRRRASG